MSHHHHHHDSTDDYYERRANQYLTYKLFQSGAMGKPLSCLQYLLLTVLILLVTLPLMAYIMGWSAFCKLCLDFYKMFAEFGRAFTKRN